MSDLFDKAKTLPEQPPALLLALTLYGEARGEPIDGKKAVAWVVRNRMAIAARRMKERGSRHPLYGDGSVAGVVLKKYQFSCWNPGDPNLHKMLDIVQTNGESAGAGLWAILRAVAEGVLADPPEWLDPTGGATHYCTPLDKDGKPLWNSADPEHDGAWFSAGEIDAGRTKETVTLGNHVFAKVA